jgi:hypothetical protein
MDDAASAVRAEDVRRILALIDRAEGLSAAIAARAGDVPGLLDRRLAPDMLSLAEQAVVLADGLVGALALLAGETAHPRAAHVFNRGHGMDFGPLPRRPADLGPLFADARREAARLAPAAAVSTTTVVRLSRPGDVRLFDADAFLARSVLPNGEFHLAMIHAIARAAGVPLGKRDFEGPRPWRRPDEGPQA